MNKSAYTLLSIFICLLFSRCLETETIRDITISRTIEIPMHRLDDASGPGLEMLTITAGGEDELPQGPQSFDVFDDRSFVITDPLRQRLVLYDSLGHFLRELKIGFSASQVSILEDGNLEVLNQKTDSIYLMDDQGNLLAKIPAGLKTRESAGSAKLLKSNRGLIRNQRTRGEAGETVEVKFKSDSTLMIAMENLGTDDMGNTYVILETTKGGDVVNVQKILRKYSPDGKILCQIQDIVLDYVVSPIDEFRVKDGMFYHLVPQAKKLLIRIWNTN